MVFTQTEISPSCIMCRGTDTLDHDAFIELFQELARTRGPLAGISLYCDIRGCHSTLNFNEELRIIEYVREHMSLFMGSKWAFVTDSLLIYGLARMGQILSAQFPFKYAVFREPGLAMNWLGCSSPEIISAIDECSKSLV